MRSRDGRRWLLALLGGVEWAFCVVWGHDWHLMAPLGGFMLACKRCGRVKWPVTERIPAP
jgi:hypothetical protein